MDRRKFLGLALGVTPSVLLGQGKSKVKPDLAVSVLATPTAGDFPLVVSFSAHASGGKPPYVYAWTFGDGKIAAGASVAHTYASEGVFSAMAKVTDRRGATAFNSVMVYTTAPVPPPEPPPEPPPPDPPPGYGIPDAGAFEYQGA